MSVDISQANITKADLPLTFWCEDFPGLCCMGWCHESSDFLVMRRRLITVYPESIFSQPHMAKMPDFSLGLSAEVCCGKYEAARALPRTWWVRKYGEKRGYKEEHITVLLNATPETYFRLSGEIASLYYTPSDSVPVGRVGPNSGGRAVVSSKRVMGVSRSTSYVCSGCGSSIKRNADICDNCGQPQ